MSQVYAQGSQPVGFHLLPGPVLSGHEPRTARPGLGLRARVFCDLQRRPTPARQVKRVTPLSAIPAHLTDRRMDQDSSPASPSCFEPAHLGLLPNAVATSPPLGRSRSEPWWACPLRPFSADRNPNGPP